MDYLKLYFVCVIISLMCMGQAVNMTEGLKADRITFLRRNGRFKGTMVIFVYISLLPLIGLFYSSRAINPFGSKGE